MQLSLPCNWDLELIEATKDLPVVDFYGMMNKSPVGGGRPSFLLPKVTEDQVIEFIEKSHAQKRKFSYILNAPTMGNLEFDPKYHRKLLDYLQWLVDIKVDFVHVSNPYLMEVIIEQFPQLEIKASIICDICSPDKALSFENMGVSNINLGHEVVRDFAAIQSIRNAVKIPLVIIPNIADLRQCPYRNYHFIIMSFSSQIYDENIVKRHWAMDPCKLQCSEKFLTRPLEIIKSCFIRPEDLHFYDEVGIDCYKISGRIKNTEWITKVANAYVNREYDGNLIDLMDTIVISMNDIQELQLDHISTSDIGLPEFFAFGNMDINISDMIYLDNKKLDGFIDHFVNGGCNPSRNCDECGYCKKWVDQVIKIDPDLSAEYLKVIRNHRRALRTSKFAKKEGKIIWDEQIRNVFEAMTNNTPEQFREIAKAAISAQAENNAKERGSTIIEEEDLVKAYITSTPAQFKEKVIADLKAKGMNVEKYL